MTDKGPGSNPDENNIDGALVQKIQAESPADYVRDRDLVVTQDMVRQSMLEADAALRGQRGDLRVEENLQSARQAYVMAIATHVAYLTKREGQSPLEEITVMLSEIAALFASNETAAAVYKTAAEELEVRIQRLLDISVTGYEMMIFLLEVILPHNVLTIINANPTTGEAMFSPDGIEKMARVAGQTARRVEGHFLGGATRITAPEGEILSLPGLKALIARIKEDGVVTEDEMILLDNSARAFMINAANTIGRLLGAPMDDLVRQLRYSESELPNLAKTLREHPNQKSVADAVMVESSLQILFVMSLARATGNAKNAIQASRGDAPALSARSVAPALRAKKIQKPDAPESPKRRTFEDMSVQEIGHVLMEVRGLALQDADEQPAAPVGATRAHHVNIEDVDLRELVKEAVRDAGDEGTVPGAKAKAYEVDVETGISVTDKKKET